MPDKAETGPNASRTGQGPTSHYRLRYDDVESRLRGHPGLDLHMELARGLEPLTACLQDTGRLRDNYASDVRKRQSGLSTKVLACD
jgi:hypothetical protein